MRFKVVGVGVDGLAQDRDGGLVIAQNLQHLALQREQAGGARVDAHGGVGVLLRTFVIIQTKGRVARQQPGLGAMATRSHFFHARQSFGETAGLNQRLAQCPRQIEIALMRAFQRSQQRDGLRTLPLARVAFPQQRGHAHIARIAIVQRLQLAGGGREVVLLVIGQSEIQPQTRIAGGVKERGAVLHNRFVQTPQVRKGGSQIGAHFNNVRAKLQQLPILQHRGCVIATLLRLQRILEKLPGVGDLRHPSAGEQDKARGATHPFQDTPTLYNGTSMPLTRRELLTCLGGAAFAQTSPGGSIFEIVPNEKSGIFWVHDNAKSVKRWLPESMCSGCAFLDYDNDGWMDILLINTGPSSLSSAHQFAAQCALPE
jgi:hypothetical protein